MSFGNMIQKDLSSWKTIIGIFPRKVGQSKWFGNRCRVILRLMKYPLVGITYERKIPKANRPIKA